MTTPHVMLAEDFSGVLGLFVLVCFLPVIGALLGIAFAKRWPKIAFTCGILSVLIGILLLVMMATTRGGAPSFIWVMASLPLLIGLRCLARWNRVRK